MAIFRKRRTREEGVCVHRAEAPLGDAQALAQLLGPLPESQELAPRLRERYFARAWDPQAQRDYWILSDGSRVACFTISGLTLRQAAAVRVRWDAMSGRAALNEQHLADLIAGEIGRAVTLLG